MLMILYPLKQIAVLLQPLIALMILAVIFTVISFIIFVLTNKKINIFKPVITKITAYVVLFNNIR